MKQAFSLLELAFCIVVLGFVFSFYYLIFINPSLDSIYYNQKLFDEEKELLKQSSMVQKKEVMINNHYFFELSTKKFNLKSLTPKDLSYQKAYLDEKSF